MRRRWIPAALLALCLALAAVNAAAADPPQWGNEVQWSYDADTCTMTITGNGPMPEGAPCELMPHVTRLVISEGITSISDDAFRYCYDLEQVSIPSSVTSIGASAFSNCSLTSIDLPQGLVSIGDRAFYGCDSLTGVTFPQGLVSIGDSAFYDCNSLTGVTFPQGLTSIGPSAFSNCRKLTGVTLPGDNLTVGEQAFWGCDGLKEVTVSGDNVSLGRQSFSYCDKLARVTISGTNAAIGDEAFSFCYALTTVEIKDAASIGNKAFSYCGALTTVKIQGNMGSVGDMAFSYCDALTTVEVGGNLDTLGESAFYFCGALTTVKIQGDAGAIGTYAFSNCDALTTVEVGGDLDAVGESAFSSLKTLKEVHVGGALGDIGKSAFSGCTGLTSFPSAGSMTGEIGFMAFSGCTGLHRILLPEGVTDINGSAFENCANLTAIWIPASVKYFGSGSLNRDTVKDVYYAGAGGQWEAIDGYRPAADSTTGLPVIHFDSPRQFPETEAADSDTLRQLIDDGIGAGLTEVELTGDIDLGGSTLSIEDNCNVLLDLKGHRITSGADPAITIVGALTVKDSTETAPPAVTTDHRVTYSCTGNITGGGSNVIDVRFGGAFTLQGGTIRGGSSDTAAITVNGPRTDEENRDGIETTVTVKGGYVDSAGPAVLASGETSIYISGGVLTSSGGEAVLLGGAEETWRSPSISMHGSGVLIHRSSQFSCGVYLPRKGYVSFWGGRILVENGVGILMRGGHLSVYDGRTKEIAAGGSGTGALGGSPVALPAGKKIVLDQKSRFCGLGQFDLYYSVADSLTGEYAPEAIPVDGYELKRERGRYFFGPVVSCQVTFDPNGGTGAVVTMTTDSSGRITALPLEPSRPGYIFRGWGTGRDWTGYYLGVGSNLSRDTILYAQWTPVGAYIIEFRYYYEISENRMYKLTDTNGVLSDWPGLEVPDGTLLGWFTDSGGGEEYSEDHVFTTDTTVWGRFPPKTPPPYHITFDPNGGSGSAVTLTTDDRGKLSSWPSDPTREGYVFMGWSWGYSGSTVGQGYTFYQDETLYAHWMPEGGYVISFSRNEDGSGTVSEARNTGLNGRLHQWPDTPQRPGTEYIFSGWYTQADGGSRLARDHSFYGNTTVYAHWLQRSSAAATGAFIITFDPNGGTGGTVLVTEPGGRLAFLPYSDPVRAGYVFGGWFDRQTGGAAVNTTTVFTADATVYAHWTPDGGTPPEEDYTVTFDSRGGSAVSSQTVAGGGKVTRPDDPTRAGYTFGGWFREAACTTAWNFDTDTAAGNMTLYAKWTPEGTTPPEGDYTVTFDSRGGGAVSSQTVAGGGKAAKPSDPTRAGYTFGGWFREEACTTAWNFDTDTVAGNMTLYAKWTPEGTTPPEGDYTVTFDSRGGSAVSSQTVAGGGKAAKPSDPTRAGYAFGGWYREAACTTQWNFDTDTVTGNVTLYAKWTPDTDPDDPHRFTVIFDPNGGEGGGTLTTGTDGKLAALPVNPVRPGYTFGGWFTQRTGGTAVTTATVFTADATVYARWTTAGACYRIYLPGRTPGGSLYVSHTMAQAGTQVDLELRPRRGYEVDWVAVTDLDTGRELRLWEYGTEEYTFTMPAADVEVEAAFFLRSTGGSSSGGSSGGSVSTPPTPPAGRTPIRWYYSGGAIYHVVNGRVPDGTWLTRDMLISVLYNLDETSAGEPEFWATSRGVIPDIYRSWLWGADKAISREQAAAILYSYAQYRNYNNFDRADLSGYTDQDVILPIARPAVSWARATGLITGTSAKTLSPKSLLTARQGGVIVARFVGDLAT